MDKFWHGREHCYRASKELLECTINKCSKHEDVVDSYANFLYTISAEQKECILRKYYLEEDDSMVNLLESAWKEYALSIQNNINISKERRVIVNRPKICDVLGVEVGQPFKVKNYETVVYMINGDGKVVHYHDVFREVAATMLYSFIEIGVEIAEIPRR